MFILSSSSSSSHYITLDYSDKCFKKFQSLYIISIIEQTSFQPVSKNRQRCGGSDVLGRLVPDRGGHNDKTAVANSRTSGSKDASTVCYVKAKLNVQKKLTTADASFKCTNISNTPTTKHSIATASKCVSTSLFTIVFIYNTQQQLNIQNLPNAAAKTHKNHRSDYKKTAAARYLLIVKFTCPVQQQKNLKPKCTLP